MNNNATMSTHNDDDDDDDDENPSHKEGRFQCRNKGILCKKIKINK